MSVTDVDRFREALLEERRRVTAAIENLHDDHPGTLSDETGEEVAYDNHLADTATETYDRELDYTLEENSEHVLGEIDAALARIEDGTYGTCTTAARRSPRSGSRPAPGRLSASGASASGKGVERARILAPRRCPRRLRDRRPHPDLDGGTPMGATWVQWVSLAAVAFSALAADQLTKAIVTSRLDLYDQVHVVGSFSIHHVANSGIAFGFFSSATPIVILLTSVAVAWMLYFFARSGSRHPILPVALGLVIGGSVSNLVDRVRLGHVTDFLDLRYWPAFNLADTFIVVGVAALLLALVDLGPQLGQAAARA